MKGSLHKRKTKRGLKPGEHSWSIILGLGRDEKTKKYKQKWVTFHGTRQQAEAKLTELVGEVHHGEFVEPSKLTVSQWLDEWLDKAIKPPRCTINTYRLYTSIIRKHLKPALGTHTLQRLTSLHLERYYADSVLSPRTVGVHHAMLTSALSSAVNAGLLRSNPAKRATNKPRIRPTEDALHNVWTAAEARRFLTHLKQTGDIQLISLFSLALDSGARKGELLGLKWTDVTDDTLRIDRQLVTQLSSDGKVERADNGQGEPANEPANIGRQLAPAFILPKGKRARQLQLSAETLSLLKTHKQQQAELKLKNRPYYADHGLIFAQTYEHHRGHQYLGSPLNIMTMNVQLDKLCGEISLKRITVHGLRHTCATLLLSAGVPPHVVQRRLGHKNIGITLDTYGHVLPSMQADAASKLAGLLHG